MKTRSLRSRWLTLVVSAFAGMSLLTQSAWAEVGTVAPLDLEPVECIFTAEDVPVGVFAVFCIEILLVEGQAKFGSVENAITDPVKIRQVVGLSSTGGLVPIVEGDGEGSELAFPPVKVPGGLLGALGVSLGDLGLGEVEALIEPVNGINANLRALGPMTQSAPDIGAFLFGNGLVTTASLPLQVNVQNLLLGDNCNIGSAEDPIALALDLNLTGGYQVAGGGPVPGQNHSQATGVTGYARLDATDDSFAIPGATGCGVAGTGDLLGQVLGENPIDGLINSSVGLPSPSGNNLIDFDGWFGLRAALIE